MLLPKCEQISIFYFCSASGNDMISHQRSIVFCSSFKRVWSHSQRLVSAELRAGQIICSSETSIFLPIEHIPITDSIKAGFLWILASRNLRANRFFSCLFQKKTASECIVLGITFLCFTLRNVPEENKIHIFLMLGTALPGAAL